MTWVTYSILMFVASVALYLTVRKSALAGVPTYLTNLSIFIVPFVVFLTIGVSSPQDFSLSSWQWLVVLVSAIVFAYGSSAASLRAIAAAPNPGYSLVLSKSYVLFTTIVAITLLGAEIDLRRLLAILVIVGFSTLIIFNRKGAKHVPSHNWVVLSLAAFFGWGMLSLSSSYLFMNGVGTIPFLIVLFGIVTACIVLTNRAKLFAVKKLDRSGLALLLATGILATVFNLGNFEAIRLAPNVAYVNAINAASISLVTVMAVVLFKDELSRAKAIGIIGVTVGLFMLLLY